MLRSIRFLACVSVIALIMALPAEAQRRGFGGMRPGNVSPARLLTFDPVQEELELTAKQQAEVLAINEALTSGRHELFAQVPKESGQRSSKMAELEQAAQTRIEKLLTESQLKRLNELLLQVNGAAELSRKEIADTLHLTKEQRKELAAVRRANAEFRHESLENFDGDRTAKSAELQREANAKLLEVLSEEQQKQFEAMQGKRIDFDLFSA